MNYKDTLGQRSHRDEGAKKAGKEGFFISGTSDQGITRLVSMAYYDSIDGLLRGPDMIFEHSPPRGSCDASLESLCRTVIFEQKPTTFTSQNFYLIPKVRKVKKASLRNWHVSKNRSAPKGIKFSKKYEGFKNNLKYLKLSKYFKKLESIGKL